MSNSDVEDDWVPNGRPKSTLAKSFSAALDDAFNLDADLEGLSQSVEQKKRNVSSRQFELEELEAKIRKTEERLKQSTSRSSSPATKANLPNHSKPGDTDATSPSRPSGLRRGVSSEENGRKIASNTPRPFTRKPEDGSGQKQAANGTFLQEDDEDSSEEEEDTEDHGEQQKPKR